MIISISLAQKYHLSSPHTPPTLPIVPQKRSTYHSSPIDLDANSSGSHSHPHSRRTRVAYSPSSSKRRRAERSICERTSDYYSSKRNNDVQNHRHSREIVIKKNRFNIIHLFISIVET